MLLLLQIIIVFAGILYFWNKDRYCCIFYSILYLYSLPCEIAYLYYPDFLGQYYLGYEYGNLFVIFITLSFVFLFVFGALGHRVAFTQRIFMTVENVSKKSKYKTTALLITLVISLIQLFLIIKYWDFITYYNIVSDKVEKPFGVLFLKTIHSYIGYIIVVFFGFILAYLTRKREGKITLILISFLLSSLNMLLFSIKSGDRAELVGTIVGCISLTILNRKVSMKTIGKIAVCLIGAFAVMLYIRSARSSEVSYENLAEILLKQDYLLPAINIVAVIKNNFISFEDWFLSSLSKSTFILFEYDYLHQTVNGLLLSDTSGSAGLGFNMLTEGYVVWGWLGVLYNGLIINMWLRIWKFIAKTNDSQTTSTLMAIQISMFFALVRAETVYFIRMLLLYFIIAFIFYIILTGKKVRILSK